MQIKRGGACLDNKTNILIVDDNREFTNMLREYLSTIDEFNVVGVAYNGKEALEKIEKGTSPSLIVSDVIMPEIEKTETL